MQLRKDYHVEVNEHAALMVCRAFLFVLLAHFMHGKSCIGNGKLPAFFFPASSLMGQLTWNFLKGFHKHFFVHLIMLCTLQSLPNLKQ